MLRCRSSIPVHGPDSVGSVICGGAGNTCFTDLPCSAFAASTNGLKVDPACRPVPPPCWPRARSTFERVVVPASHVRTDGAALVERDHRSLRILRLVQHLRDCRLCRLLIVEIQGRRDP